MSENQKKSEIDIYELIQNGEILQNAQGNTSEEVFKDICAKISNSKNFLSSKIEPNELFEQLCEREKSISTAMGDGIAFPHPAKSLVKNIDEQRIVLCFLENEIDMKSFDGKKVDKMFLILSYNQEEHLKILQKLAIILQNNDFKNLLSSKPNLEQLRFFFESL